MNGEAFQKPSRGRGGDLVLHLLQYILLLVLVLSIDDNIVCG